MEIAAAHTLHQALAGDRSSFAYSGEFEDDHTARLLAFGEAVLNTLGARRDHRNRLAFIMVEAYQNIIRHRAPLSREMAAGAGRSMFLLRCRADYEQVLAINPLRRSDVVGLNEQLRRLAGMDRMQLKELFLSSLQNNGQEQRRGAGLGLIEMARRSGRELAHQLIPLDPEHELFLLRVAMGEVPPGGSEVDLATAEKIHQLMSQHDVQLIFRGARSPGVQEAVLRIIEKDVGDPDRAAARAQAFLAIMEYLSGSGPEQHDALVVLSRSAQGPRFTVGCRLSPGRVREHVEAVHQVMNMDRAGLQQHYREALLRRTRGEEAGGIGLFDLARHANAPLAHATQEDPDGGAFTALQILV